MAEVTEGADYFLMLSIVSESVNNGGFEMVLAHEFVLDVHFD